MKSLIHRYLDGAYAIGFIENLEYGDTMDIYGNVKWLNTAGYTGGWFADPFIISADDSIITLLVEEYRYDTSKGRISELTVRRNGFQLLNVKPVLELDTHLSFPYPISVSGQMYICPENCAAEEVALYKYDGQRLHDKTVILKGRYIDSQIVKLKKNFIFSPEKLTITNMGG